MVQSPVLALKIRAGSMRTQTTTYGTLGRTIVDGRWFIKGGDAIYCYDLRQIPGKRDRVLLL